MMASLDHGEGSVNNMKVHHEHHEDGDQSISRQKQSSCSSSLSNSSLESVVLDENNENGISDHDTFESKHADNELPAFSLSSDYAYPSPVWSFQSASAPQCPPSQMMARPGYDPNRIPASVFSSRPANPLAWSHTSNDSDLFSIQAGNNSFTSDPLSLGNRCVESPRFNELISKSTSLHPVEEVVPSNCADKDIIEGHSDSVSTRVACEETRDSPMVMHCESVKTLAESAAIELHETPEDNSKDAMAPREEAKNITSVSSRSEESRISRKSFQFPLLSSFHCGRKGNVTKKSEKLEEDKPLEPPSAEAEKATNPRLRKRWYFPSSCRSPCR